MKVDTTYEQLHKDMPEVTEALLKKIGDDIDVSELKFSIDVVQMIRDGALSAADLFSPVGMQKRQAEKERYRSLTAEERFSEIEDDLSCSVVVTKGRTLKSMDVDTVPVDVKNAYIQSFKEAIEEEARLDAMTPEELQTDINDLLSQLGADPGFMAIQIPTEEG